MSDIKSFLQQCTMNLGKPKEVVEPFVTIYFFPLLKISKLSKVEKHLYSTIESLIHLPFSDSNQFQIHYALRDLLHAEVQDKRQNRVIN